MTTTVGKEAPCVNLLVKQGSIFEKHFYIKNSVGVLIDITGSTFAGKIKRDRLSTSITIASFTFTVNTLLSKVTFELPVATSRLMEVGATSSSAASRYVYDIEWTPSGGKPDRIMSGALILSPEATT